MARSARESPATVTTAANGPFWLAVTPDQGPEGLVHRRNLHREVSNELRCLRPRATPTGRSCNSSWDFGDGAEQGERRREATRRRYPKTGTVPVRLTLTDDAGCSTQFVFTGQQALCNGGAAATATTRTVRDRQLRLSFGPIEVGSLCAPRDAPTVVLACASNAFGPLQRQALPTHAREGCRGVRRKRLALGSKTFTIAPGKSNAWPLKPRKPAKVLAEEGPSAFGTRASVNAHDAANVSKKTSAKGTLKLAKQRKRR